MKNILVPIDLGDLSQKIINYSSDFSRSNGGFLHFLYVIPINISYIVGDMGVQYVQGIDDELIENDNEKIREFITKLIDPDIPHSITIVQGIPTETILDKANELAVDLIIMGSHGRGLLYEALVGSVASDILKDTNIPVLIIPDKFRKEK